jgi:hypothetical protein
MPVPTRKTAVARYACRKGHSLPTPQVLAKGTHPSSICSVDGSIIVYAPRAVSDDDVRGEIKMIARAVAGRPEICLLNAMFDALALPVVSNVVKRGPKRQLKHYRELLDTLESR